MSDENERQMVKIEVVTAWSDEEWTFDEFMALMNSIPAEFRGTTKVAFEGGFYDSGCHFEVSYQRPETDEEMAARARKDAEYEADRLRSQRAQYEALKKKFG